MKKKKHFTISPRYIVDEAGKKEAVVLDVSTFEKLMEYLEDAVAKDVLESGEFVDFEEVNKDILKK